MKALGKFKSSVLLTALILTGCASDSSTQSSDSLSCSATSAYLVSGSSNQISLAISATGGTANYTLSSVVISGYSGTLVSGSSSTSFSSDTYPTIYFSSLSSSSLSGATGTVTITDSSSSNEATSCSFTVGSSSSSALSCSMSPATSTPYVNVVDQITISGSGGTAPYTFSGFSAGNYGTVTTSLSTSNSQGSVAVSYYASGTATPSVTITDSYGNSANCSTTLSVQSSSSSSSSPSCYLTHSISGNSVFLSATSSNGQSVTFASISPGADGSIGSYGNPATLNYSSSGTKYVSVTGYLTSSGQYCNSGSAMTDSFYVGYGYSSGGSLGCVASLNPTSVSRGSYFTAVPSYTNTGSGNPFLKSVSYASSSGGSTYFSNAQTAHIRFPYSGSWLVTLVVQDSAGNTASCSGYETVY